MFNIFNIWMMVIFIFIFSSYNVFHLETKRQHVQEKAFLLDSKL